ncbi:MAG: carA, partial [Ramlibacter sp.]|nr:carA [Ramlibacter sp.]
MTLQDYLRREQTVGISNIDTRKLTRILRTKGAQNGCIIGLEQGSEVTPDLVEKAVALARKAPDMAGQDLAKDVSVSQSYGWDQTEWHLGEGYGHLENPRYHVVAFDYGVKNNILRMLAERGCKV